MPPLYALTPRTAAGLRGLLADGGEVGTPARSGTPARGTTWVKVTGAISSGWYPGVVSIDQAGTFVDSTLAVLVASADSLPLTNGKRYQCTRTGDDGSDVARFRTIGQAYPDLDNFVQVMVNANFALTAFGADGAWHDVTDSGANVEMTLPGGGVYYVWGTITGVLEPAFTGVVATQARLRNVTDAAPVGGAGCCVVSCTGREWGSGGFSTIVDLTGVGNKTLRLQAGTWAVQTFAVPPYNLTVSTINYTLFADGTTVTAIGWVRIG